MSDLHGVNPNVELAIDWSLEGHRVLPVSPPPGKKPLIKAWQDNATMDQVQIHDWWWRMPDARVGIATGAPGFDVLDFDVADGKPGLAQMEKLLELGLLVPGTFRMQTTPSGGRHLLFKGTTQRNKQNEKSIPGVDFRGQGGQILAPGNPGYKYVTGKHIPYADLATIDWEQVRAALAPPDTPASTGANPPVLPRPGMPPGPPRPVERTRSGKTRLVAPMRAFDDPIGEESPLDWYTRNHDIENLLRDAGWAFAAESGGRRHYRRPGKDTDVSGNVHVMPDGRTVFYNFSSSVDLPTDTAMSTAQLYAYLEHGGDMRAAASEIRRGMMPRQAPPIPPAAPPATAPPTTPLHVPSVVLSTGTDLEVIQGVPRAVTEFWDQRPELRNIRWIAKQRRVNPWAVLGAVLAQVACRIGPHVVLPPIVGGVASLNLLVGLVGPSGLGKGAATAVAQEYMKYDGQYMVEEIGSPQGIDSCFSESSQEGVVQFNDVALFTVPEIDTITGHGKQQGGSQLMMATIRKLYSGEMLGARYANKDLRRTVRAHCYRAAMICGIQPSRSAILLDDADGGTPQRWLWMPVTDPEMRSRKEKLKSPWYHGSPPQVEYDVWIPEGEQRDPEKNKPLPVTAKSRYEIPVCQTAIDMILDIHEAKHRGEAGALDTHAPLTRLKVAALLAFLDGRAEVSEADWQLSMQVMWISNATRATCQTALAEVQVREARERGRARAEQAVTEDVHRVVVKDKHAARVAELSSKALGLLVGANGGWVPPREMRIRIGDAAANRDYGDDVWRSLRATPGVEEGPETMRGGKPVRMWRYTPLSMP